MWNLFTSSWVFWNMDKAFSAFYSNSPTLPRVGDKIFEWRRGFIPFHSNSPTLPRVVRRFHLWVALHSPEFYSFFGDGFYDPYLMSFAEPWKGLRWSRVHGAVSGKFPDSFLDGYDDDVICSTDFPDVLVLLHLRLLPERCWGSWPPTLFQSWDWYSFSRGVPEMSVMVALESLRYL